MSDKSLEKRNKLFIYKDKNILYLSRKIEKISAALYIVTALLNDTDPLRLKIRTKSLDIMSLILSATGEQFHNDSFVHLVDGYFYELIALLDVAFYSNSISSMNYSILKGELEQTSDFIHSLTGVRVSLDPQFFDVAPQTAIEGQKDNHNVLYNMSFKNPKILNKSQKSERIKDKNVSKIERQDKIINLLKTKANLTVKDFLGVIKDCSEKTIQRELQNLVVGSVLKRAGERRWSRYSLV